MKAAREFISRNITYFRERTRNHKTSAPPAEVSTELPNRELSTTTTVRRSDIVGKERTRNVVELHIINVSTLEKSKLRREEEETNHDEVPNCPNRARAHQPISGSRVLPGGSQKICEYPCSRAWTAGRGDLASPRTKKMVRQGIAAVNVLLLT